MSFPHVRSSHGLGVLPIQEMLPQYVQDTDLPGFGLLDRQPQLMEVRPEQTEGPCELFAKKGTGFSIAHFFPLPRCYRFTDPCLERALHLAQGVSSVSVWNRVWAATR